MGFTPGTLIELSYIKYHQKYGKFKSKKLENICLLIDKRTIKKKLPKTFEEQIKNIYYYSNFQELEKILKKINNCI